MKTQWIPLSSIPAEGKTFIYDDEGFWQSAIEDRSVPGRFTGPVRAEVFVLPQEDGALLRGKIYGTVILCCDRCQEDCRVTIKESFDSFEPYPPEPELHAGRRVRFEAAREEAVADPLEVDAEVVRLSPLKKGVEINPAALALEEFILALPFKPLCSEECKGLCALCGCNKNEETCACSPVREDPRLEPLKKLSFGKK